MKICEYCNKEFNPNTRNQIRCLDISCAKAYHNEYNKKYYLNNKDKIKEYEKKNYLRNSERRKEYSRQYRLKNKKKIKEYIEEYRLKNADKIKAYYEKNKEKRREYYLKNKDKRKAYLLKKKEEKFNKELLEAIHTLDPEHNLDWTIHSNPIQIKEKK